MKFLISIFFLFSLLFGYAQIDTTLDYKERFYVDGKILTENITINNLKQGKWIVYYDRKWKECNEKNSKFYRLAEYKNDSQVGKVYDFYQSGQLQMVGCYDTVNLGYKVGTFIYFDKKGRKTSLEHYTQDTLTRIYYHKNGNEHYNDVYIKGREWHSYRYSKTYYKNGRPKDFDCFENRRDTSYLLWARRNGSNKWEAHTGVNGFESISQNRKGELTSRRYGKNDSDTTFVEKYRKGRLVSKEIEIKKKYDYEPYNGYPHITYYEGQIGGNSAKIIIQLDDTTLYRVNGVDFSRQEYMAYEKRYDSVMNLRKPIHIYEYYTNDSILVYSGLYKNIDQPCGFYKEYYPTGTLRIKGWYDDKGRKSGVWYYYNEKEYVFSTEYYRKGIKEDIIEKLEEE